MHTLIGTFLRIHHRLDHASKDVWIDVLPVQFATLNDDAAGFGAHPWYLNALREQTAVDVRKLLDDAQRLLTTQRDVHDIKGPRQIVWEVWTVVLRIALDAGGKEVFLEDTCIFCKEAEEQAGNKNVQVVQVIVATKLVVASQFIVQFGQFFCRLDVLHIVNALYIHQRIEESKVWGQTLQLVLVGVLLA